MISGAVGKKVLGGAVSALELAYGAARHAAWYFAYHAAGKTRDGVEPEQRK
jgi:hypothetical protein